MRDYQTRSKNDQDEYFSDYKKFFTFNEVKQFLTSNNFLIVVFLLLICIFNVVRFTYFFGTDPWLHIFIAKSIVKMRYLPLGEYYGSIGLPLFTAVIHMFSGVDFILIPKYFVFYTILVSALVFYNILLRIFKNRNIAIFGVFLLEFSGLGFAYMMYQFWPAHIVFIQLLTIFLILYIRFQKFIKIERPSNSDIFSGMILTYSLIIFIFISALLTHILTALILLLCYIWIYLIYFSRDFKRGIDLLLLCGLFAIFGLFIVFGLSSEHFFFIDNGGNFYLSPLAIGALVGTGVIGAIIVWRFKKSILFSTGRFTKVILGLKSRFFKTIEDKIILPLAFLIIALLGIIYFIGNMLIFNLPITSVFTTIEILILSSFAIWGLILFQKKPRGKPFLIWIVFFGFFLLAVFIFDLLITQSTYWARVFFMTPPLIVIGFTAYIYKLIKSKAITEKSKKIFVIFVIGFSLCTTYFHEFATVQYVSLTRRQVGGAQWYSEHTRDQNVIITEFGFNYMFYYYDYPYNEGDKDLQGRDIHEFEDTKNKEYFDPDEHVDDEENELKELKEEEETDVVITLDDQYFLNKGWETYGYVSEDEMDEYYEKEYLNRIYSAKSEDGTENPYYWVI
ncbi:MAG: hypothetical protein GF353_05220 [Candidatus Lokiarchaeota archaeon]|nr:hypothetical protein [Candidatus Lokiarchaeota archaeon]